MTIVPYPVRFTIDFLGILVVTIIEIEKNITKYSSTFIYANEI